MTARLSVRGKLDRPWDVPCTCGNRYAEHTDGEGCRVCACSRYRSIETAAAEQRVAGLREALTELRDTAQAFRAKRSYDPTDSTEGPFANAIVKAGRALSAASGDSPEKTT